MNEEFIKACFARMDRQDALAKALADALTAMLREHDALVLATGGTSDRWPTAAQAARKALTQYQESNA
jgi:hypothetical protein